MHSVFPIFLPKSFVTGDIVGIRPKTTLEDLTVRDKVIGTAEIVEHDDCMEVNIVLTDPAYFHLADNNDLAKRFETETKAFLEG